MGFQIITVNREFESQGSEIAQAVAARTYAMRAQKTGGNYDLTDSASAQVFRGYNASYKNAISAVDFPVNRFNRTISAPRGTLGFSSPKFHNSIAAPNVTSNAPSVRS